MRRKDGEVMSMIALVLDVDRDMMKYVDDVKTEIGMGRWISDHSSLQCKVSLWVHG